MLRWSWIAVCFCPPFFFCMFSFAQTTSMNSGWTIRCCWGFMIYVSWSVTQTSAGWQSGVKWLAAQDKLSRYDLELLNLSQIPSETAVNQSLNLSLYLSFCLLGSWQLNFPKAGRQKKKTSGICCYTDVSLQTVASHDVCFYEFERARVWTSSYPLQPSVATSFPQRREQGGGGKGSWQSTALTHPLD